MRAYSKRSLLLASTAFYTDNPEHMKEENRRILQPPDTGVLRWANCLLVFPYVCTATPKCFFPASARLLSIIGQLVAFLKGDYLDS